MEESSQRILVEAAYNGVIRSEESSLRRIPHSSLPVPKFAAKILPCSAPLKHLILKYLISSFLFHVLTCCQIPKTDELKATMKNDVYQWRRALHVPVLIVLQVRTICLLTYIMRVFRLTFRSSKLAGHGLVLTI